MNYFVIINDPSLVTSNAQYRLVFAAANTGGTTLAVDGTDGGLSFNPLGNALTIGGTTTIGGGYGDTGITLEADGDLSMDGNLVVDGYIDLDGDLDVNGTANLDVVDIDGAVDMASTLTVASDIIHGSDTDTMISFGLDQIDFKAGNAVFAPGNQ